METKIYDAAKIAEAAELLKEGQLIAFPTETVYGLGAIASNDEAVKEVYRVKGRPSDNPLIVHVASAAIEDYVAHVPAVALPLMEQFWPGPLTLIFPVKEGVFAPTVTAGHETVALRMPDQPETLKLIAAAGFPLVGPSANTSGKPSPTTAEHVYHDLNNKIAGILDGGPTHIGVESTVLDLTNEDGPVILRPGALTEEDLVPVIGPLGHAGSSAGNENTAPKAPGMKYKHYSPSQPVILVKDEAEAFGKLIRQLQQENKTLGMIASEEILSVLGEAADFTFSLGKKAAAEEASRRLYAALRYMDQQPVDVILAEEYPKTGIGIAYMNRLEKASSYKFPQDSPRR